MYILSHTYVDRTEPGLTVEDELMTEEGEIDKLFASTWSEEGYTQYITTIDDISEYEIELDASEYFSSVELNELRVFIDSDDEPGADLIEGFLITLRGV